MSEARFLQEASRLWEAGTAWAGLPDAALAFVLGQAAAEERVLVVVEAADRADRLVRALQFFHPDPRRVLAFPADDVRPYDGFSPDPALPAERIRTLQQVQAGGACIVVAPVHALLQRIPDDSTRQAGSRMLRRGQTLERDDLVEWLSQAGYLAAGRVDVPGSFATRGDVLDVWPAGRSGPVRLDFFDDELEDLRRFDPSSQRTTRPLGRVALLPAREERLDRAAMSRLSAELARHVREQQRGVQLRRRVLQELRAGIRFSGIEAWLPALVPTSSPLEALAELRPIVVEPEEVGAAARELWRSARQRWSNLDEEDRPLVPPTERWVPPLEVLGALESAQQVLPLALEGAAVDLGARSTERFAVRGAELAPTVKQLEDLLGLGVRIGLIAETLERATQLARMLEPHGLRPHPRRDPVALPPGDLALLVGDLPRGFVAERSGWAFVPASALFGERARVRQRTLDVDASVARAAQLKEGDHVVHRMHGIGIFRGVHRLSLQGELEADAQVLRREQAAQDFVKLEYRGGDLLYLPVTRLEPISRYHPAHSGGKVRLDRLGGRTWAARRNKVRDSLLAMAQELLELQARRELAQRPPLPPPGPTYRSFEAHFPYQETPDQADAIERVSELLGRPAPMDHLLVGDVGFGKTEVAMRAAMRVVEAGRQVAVLCPTTVLTLQHHGRFRERFDQFGVKVGMLSRFVSAVEAAEVRRGLRSGELDLVVGTTQLLGRHIRFADLGLLVVDEEHRYGVRQKARLKRLRESLDVLSMSATPIPRTLEMGMTGMRSMSVMSTPPRDRLPVRTSLARMSESRVRDAILSELERGGQVFFVHNRVADIDRIADRLASWIPEARLTVAHGQLASATLEERLVGFIRKEVDVLVCSAIIESGIDLPNVNTILVHRADRFGLAQLYQLRGRVGRSWVRGRCLLLASDDITRDARRRLQVLVEHSDLGAGLQIAIADLELRGAGNLLGDAQSGNIDAVGYETWIELLQEAVSDAKGEIARQNIDPDIQVPVAAFLAEQLLPGMAERLEWYRRFAHATTVEEVDGMVDALEDQHGDLPVETRNLAGLHVVRIRCQELGIARCAWLRVRVVLELHPRSRVQRSDLEELVKLHPKRFDLRESAAAEVPTLDVRFLPSEAERPLHFLRWVFGQLRTTARR